MFAASSRLRSRTLLGMTATFAELSSSFTLLQSTVISPTASLLNVSDEPDDLTKCPVSFSPSVNRRTSGSGFAGAVGWPQKPGTPHTHSQRNEHQVRQCRGLL